MEGRADAPISDPFADALTRFGGYRGVLLIARGRRVARSFDWSDEFNERPLPPNNQIVIYEMPVKWMSSDPGENPVVALGTLERVIFGSWVD